MNDFIELHQVILKNLEYLRKLNGYTLEYVGDSLGISKSGYRKIEKGSIHISLKHLHTLSLIYKVPLDKILFTNLASYQRTN